MPNDPAPNGAGVRPVDFGFNQEGALGGLTRIDRPGNCWEVDFTYPQLAADTARVYVARLNRAKREGLRIAFPLARLSQGNPGAPQVDGTDSAGRTLKLKGLTPGYTIKEGYWLTHVSAAGLRRLHNNSVVVAAGADGKAVLTIEPPLRAFPANNDAVQLAAPEIEGLVTSVVNWAIDAGGLFSGVNFTLHESA